MDILRTLFPCFGADQDTFACHSNMSNPFLEEKGAAYTDAPFDAEIQSAADETGDKILHLILTGPALNTPRSNAKIQEIINSDQPTAVASLTWWRNAVFRRIYNGLRILVISIKEHGGEVYDTLRTLFLDAEAFAEDFRKEHPYITWGIELIALGLLIEVLSPALLGALGFCGEKILKGSFAAWWQSSIGDVPYGSLFSKLQSLAAKYGKHLPDVASVEL